MRFASEYRDAAAARAYAEAIATICRGRWTIMEICGGQTHSIMRYGIDRLLPDAIELVHGPGCPVCVTSAELIDRAIGIASLPDAVLCTFGDMMRVPGSRTDLMSARAAGGDVRMVYSPLDAVREAAANPGREVVFFAVGFETTAPVTAAAVLRAEALGLRNFSLLTAHVLVPPAMEAILRNPGRRIRGFLAPGHVCAVTGFREYESMAADHGVPIVVTGFEPLDILEGIHMCVRQLEEGRAVVENQYVRAVAGDGNPDAIALVRRVFRPVDRAWRGIGPIAGSGLDLKPEYGAFDASLRFDDAVSAEPEPTPCIAGRILTGEAKPGECPAFGTSCTPERPMGAPMVSSEGACSAYFRYGHRHGRSR